MGTKPTAQAAAFNFLESLSLVIGATLAGQLADPLQKIYEKNPKKFKVKVTGALLLLNELSELTAKSTTKIDDVIINSIIDVVKQSAANNKIKIP